MNRGDICEAYKNSQSARMLCRVTYLFGWLIYVAVVLVVVLPIELSNNDNDNY